MVGRHIDRLGYTVSVQSEINYQLSYQGVFSLPYTNTIHRHLRSEFLKVVAYFPFLIFYAFLEVEFYTDPFTFE